MNYIFKYRFQIVFVIIGIIVIGIGLLIRSDSNNNSYVEVLSDEDENLNNNNLGKIVVEIAGAVVSPGVYELESGARVNDLIESAGGLYNENEDWVSKYINKASPLEDGQKIFIYAHDYQSNSESDSNMVSNIDSESLSGDTHTNSVNINTASKSELESLWGIGPVYAQNIIDQRPYSSVEALIEKGIIKTNVYDRNKDRLNVY